MMTDAAAGLTVDPVARDLSPKCSNADLVPIDEMAARLSVSTRFFRTFYTRHNVPHVVLGNKTIRFSPSDVVAHIKQRFGR